MSKKLKIIIACVCLLLTGCTVEYDLKIEDDTINEKIVISEKSGSFNEDSFDEIVNNSYSQYNEHGVKRYSVTKTKDDDNTKYILKQNYSLRPALYIRTFSECFDAYNIVYGDETKRTYVIQTSKGFKCMSHEYMIIDSYKINIELNHEVIDSNADSVNNNIYTWNIDKNNAKDKYISITFKKNKQEINPNQNDDDSKKKSSFNIIYVIIIGVGIILIAAIAIIYGMVLNQKQNKL